MTFFILFRTTSCEQNAGLGVPRARPERVPRAILRSVARSEEPQELLPAQPPRSVTEGVLFLHTRVSIAKDAASTSRKSMQNSG
jgi:hypothetical protein